MNSQLSAVVLVMLSSILSSISPQVKTLNKSAKIESTQLAQLPLEASQKSSQQVNMIEEDATGTIFASQDTTITAPSSQSKQTQDFGTSMGTEQSAILQANQDAPSETQSALLDNSGSAKKEDISKNSENLVKKAQNASEEDISKKDLKPSKKAMNTPKKTVYQYRQTTFGGQCVFPFSYEGQTYTNCLAAKDEKEYCKIDDVLYECQARPENSHKQKSKPQRPTRPTQVEVRFTISGKRCRLPLLVKGEYMTDCMFISSTQEICQAAGKWELCQPKVQASPQPSNKTKSTFQAIVTRTTEYGQTCEFPLYFDGKKQYDCVRMPDQREWCQVSGQWQQCTSSLASSRSNMIETGAGFDTPVDYGYTQEMDKKESQGNSGAFVVLSVLVAIVAMGVAGMTFALFRTKGQYSKLVEESLKNQVSQRRQP
eukprot:TRINITY_DN867_c1_g1_i1.p1 TRINITY_DN867_c1_g1~~TRINITY_DN867_c1_g1_i1.p1  ORF type:complete len:489 (+),score=35.76 TRINITY_DN867_c1_g1_i1:188-1468(+)